MYARMYPNDTYTHRPTVCRPTYKHHNMAMSCMVCHSSCAFKGYQFPMPKTAREHDTVMIQSLGSRTIRCRTIRRGQFVADNSSQDNSSRTIRRKIKY